MTFLLRWPYMTTTLAMTSAILAVSGCANLREAKAPIAVRSIAAACDARDARDARVDTLLVLLPGAYDKPEDFIRQGFVDAVRVRGIAVDIALVDATVPYYRERNIIERLDADVIGPARARGIRHVWIAGISIGGLGSLIYSEDKRGVVDGLLLIAPYLGERSIAAEVSASGGLANWSVPGAIPADDDDRRLWQWLKLLTRPSSTAATAPLPTVYLGYGVDDRFAASHHLLAEALPVDHVFTAAGGHDWPAWRAVWAKLLDAAPLPRDASCTTSLPASR